MDPAHILLWNVWGLNSSSRQNVVQTLVDSVKADVICLQETKMGQITR
jgi:exonuclease III